MRCPVLESATYAMSGTGIARGTFSLSARYAPSSGDMAACAVQCLVFDSCAVLYDILYQHNRYSVRQPCACDTACGAIRCPVRGTIP
eukprot:992775-Rhodomonas_salina.2